MADFKLIVLLLALVVTLCHGTRKNVLFLMADDLRAQLGAYDGPDFASQVHPKMHTPNLDSLAARSLLLKRAYVQLALCSPSRASLLTGRRPDTTMVYDLHHYFRDVGGNYTTIPQYFKQNGYRSIGMGKIFHPGAASGHDDPLSWSDPYFHGNRNFEHPNRSWHAVPDHLLTNSPLIDEQIANNAIKVLNQVSSKAKSGVQPFFMAVGFHKPHLPFVFPHSVLQHYPTNSISLPSNPYTPVNMPDVQWTYNSELRKFNDIASLNSGRYINTTLPDDNTKELRRAYYCSVTWMDSLVGRVIAELDKLGLSNDTIISFIGDHGYQLGEHAGWGKNTNFELTTQTPMMLQIPGRTDKGIQSEQLTEFVDLFPSLVDAAGLPHMTMCPGDSTHTAICREGASFLPLINHPNTPIKTAAFSQTQRHFHNNLVMGYTIRTDLYRYTEWPKFSHTSHHTGPDWTHLFGVELYDHSIDPDESFNHANESAYHMIQEELRNQLHAGWRHVLTYHSGSNVIG